MGYDTAQSTDHNWGLRLFIFLPEKDFRKNKLKIDKELRRDLPHSFLGYPTSFGEPDEDGVRLPPDENGDANHYITFLTVKSFIKQHVGVSDYKLIKPISWLTIPQQKLLEITSGKIFHDGLKMKKVISKFSYYPKDIWLYKIASQWFKISQEEAFVARASAVGDELGSKIIAARIAKEIIELCFLMGRKYAPYSKWLGSAFSQLRISRKLEPVLLNALKSDSIVGREKYLSKAYHIVAEKHNSLLITDPIPTRVSRYYNRPYMVIHADTFAKKTSAKIKSDSIRELPLIGSIDQITDSANLVANGERTVRLRILYEN